MNETGIARRNNWDKKLMISNRIKKIKLKRFKKRNIGLLAI